MTCDERGLIMINVCVCVKERERERKRERKRERERERERQLILTKVGTWRYSDTNNTPTTRFSLKCYYCCLFLHLLVVLVLIVHFESSFHVIQISQIDRVIVVLIVRHVSR